MRITPLDSKKVISVLGPPHSGTTLVCNILNSMDNAFCLSEPHWAKITNPKHVKFDKVKNLTISNPNSFMTDLKDSLNKNKYQFGGVKETFRPFEVRMSQVLENIRDISDEIIFVLRDPFAHYNSLKKITSKNNQNPVPVTRMATDLKSLLQYMKKTPNKTIVTIEDICQAGNDGFIPYFNKKSKRIKIEGKFQLIPTNFIYGNPQANKSKSISGPNMSKDQLNQQDLDFLTEKVVPLYQKILQA